MSKSNVTSINEEQFEAEVVHRAGTVLVDFYTPWCPPCRRAAPELEALSASQGAALKVVKIDANENARVAAEHNVLSVPTFVLYQDGRRIDQISGYRSKAQFEHWIESSRLGS